MTPKDDLMKRLNDRELCGQDACRVQDARSGCTCAEAVAEILRLQAMLVRVTAELAETEALEMQHGAVIERLTAQLESTLGDRALIRAAREAAEAKVAKLKALVIRAQEIIDPCYPERARTWQKVARAAIAEEGADCPGYHTPLPGRVSASVAPALCPKCGGSMADGIAIQQTYTAGMPDFPGDTDGGTMSPGGPGVIIPVHKCSACGWSLSVAPHTETWLNKWALGWREGE